MDYIRWKNQRKMNSVRLYGLIGVCLLFATLFIFKSCELERVRQTAERNHITDTVFVPIPYKVIEIRKEYIEKPVKVLIHLKDTTLRKQAEQSDIILGMNFKRHHLFQKFDKIKIDKINPQGMIFSNEYQVPTIREIKIDSKGNLQIKRKRHLGLKIIAGALIIGTSGYFIHRQIKP